MLSETTSDRVAVRAAGRFVRHVSRKRELHNSADRCCEPDCRARRDRCRYQSPCPPSDERFARHNERRRERPSDFDTHWKNRFRTKSYSELAKNYPLDSRVERYVAPLAHVGQATLHRPHLLIAKLKESLKAKVTLCALRRCARITPCVVGVGSHSTGTKLSKQRLRATAISVQNQVVNLAPSA